MMRIQLAQHFFKEGNLRIAKAVLGDNPDTIESLRFLSLLYRYEDDYVMDKRVVEYGLEVDPTDEYMQNRMVWHKSPLFDRLVPRPPLHLKYSKKLLPSPETVSKLCFITAGSSELFQVTVEMLESLSARRFCLECPIYVIDTGFTEEERRYLKTHFPNLSFLEFKNSTGYKHESISTKLFENRLYFDSILPQYDYYFWIDADVWIQDDRSILRYIKAAETYGVGITNESLWTMAQSPITTKKIIADRYWDLDLFAVSPYCCCGIMCLHKSILKEWRKIYQANVKQKGVNFYTEQISMNILVAHKKIVPIHSVNNICIFDHQPCVSEDHRTFYDTETGQIIGCVHNWGKNKFVQHYDDTYAVENDKNDKNETVLCSFRYRCWPWEDKTQLVEMINGVKNV